MHNQSVPCKPFQNILNWTIDSSHSQQQQINSKTRRWDMKVQNFYCLNQKLLSCSRCAEEVEIEYKIPPVSHSRKAVGRAKGNSKVVPCCILEWTIKTCVFLICQNLCMFKLWIRAFKLYNICNSVVYLVLFNIVLLSKNNSPWNLFLGIYKIMKKFWNSIVFVLLLETRI